jgi:hypothetical protein
VLSSFSLINSFHTNMHVCVFGSRTIQNLADQLACSRYHPTKKWEALAWSSHWGDRTGTVQQNMISSGSYIYEVNNGSTVIPITIQLVLQRREFSKV